MTASRAALALAARSRRPAQAARALAGSVGASMASPVGTGTGPDGRRASGPFRFGPQEAGAAGPALTGETDPRTGGGTGTETDLASADPAAGPRRRPDSATPPPGRDAADVDEPRRRPLPAAPVPGFDGGRSPRRGPSWSATAPGHRDADAGAGPTGPAGGSPRRAGGRHGDVGASGLHGADLPAVGHRATGPASDPPGATGPHGPARSGAADALGAGTVPGGADGLARTAALALSRRTALAGDGPVEAGGGDPATRAAPATTATATALAAALAANQAAADAADASTAGPAAPSGRPGPDQPAHPPVQIGEIHVHVAAPASAGPDALALLAPWSGGLTARRAGAS